MALWYQGNLYLCRRWNVRKWHCATKINHVVVANQIFDSGFVAKVSNLEPTPNMLDLKAQMNGRNVLWQHTPS